MSEHEDLRPGRQPLLRPVLVVSAPPPRQPVDLSAEPPEDDVVLSAADEAAIAELDARWWAECERLLALEDSLPSGADSAGALSTAQDVRAVRLAADVPLAAPGVTRGPVRSPLADALDRLQDAISAVRAEQASGSRTDTERVLRLSDQLRALGLRELAEMDVLGTHTIDGGPRSTTAGWLGRTLHLSDVAARSTARLARELTHDLPGVGRALADRDLTVEHARAVTDGVRGLDSDIVRQSQPSLITLARSSDPVSVRTHLHDRAIAVDDKLAAEAERRARERAGFTVSPVGDRYASRGSHTAEDGAIIRNALDQAVERMKADGDTRPKAARRGDVLLGWALRDLNADTPADSQANDAHTVRTHLLIGTTLQQLQQLARPDTGPGAASGDGTANPTGATDATGATGATDPTDPVETADSFVPAVDTLPLTFADALAELAEGHETGDGTEHGTGGTKDSTRARLLDNGHALSDNALRRLACDALLTLVLLPGPDGTPIVAGTRPPGPVPAPAMPDPLTSHPQSTDPHPCSGTTSSGACCELGDQLTAATTGPPGPVNPLWVGRATRTISGALFKAVAYRDKTCVIRGCHRPPAACEGHHVQHWVDGGHTVITNIVLLCHQHHHDLHDRHLDLPHRDGARWLTQTGWRWLTDHGWSDTDPMRT